LHKINSFVQLSLDGFFGALVDFDHGSNFDVEDTGEAFENNFNLIVESYAGHEADCVDFERGDHLESGEDDAEAEFVDDRGSQDEHN
jgi:hypothetical protein